MRIKEYWWYIRLLCFINDKISWIITLTFPWPFLVLDCISFFFILCTIAEEGFVLVFDSESSTLICEPSLSTDEPMLISCSSNASEYFLTSVYFIVSLIEYLQSIFLAFPIREWKILMIWGLWNVLMLLYLILSLKISLLIDMKFRYVRNQIGKRNLLHYYCQIQIETHSIFL